MLFSEHAFFSCDFFSPVFGIFCNFFCRATNQIMPVVIRHWYELKRQLSVVFLASFACASAVYFERTWRVHTSVEKQSGDKAAAANDDAATLVGDVWSLFVYWWVLHRHDDIARTWFLRQTAAAACVLGRYRAPSCICTMQGDVMNLLCNVQRVERRHNDVPPHTQTLPDCVVEHALTFADTRSVVTSAAACRQWRAVGKRRRLSRARVPPPRVPFVCSCGALDLGQQEPHAWAQFTHWRHALLGPRRVAAALRSVRLFECLWPAGAHSDYDVSWIAPCLAIVTGLLLSSGWDLALQVVLYGLMSLVLLHLMEKTAECMAGRRARAGGLLFDLGATAALLAAMSGVINHRPGEFTHLTKRLFGHATLLLVRACVLSAMLVLASHLVDRYLSLQPVLWRRQPPPSRSALSSATRRLGLLFACACAMMFAGELVVHAIRQCTTLISAAWSTAVSSSSAAITTAQQRPNVIAELRFLLPYIALWERLHVPATNADLCRVSALFALELVVVQSMHWWSIWALTSSQLSFAFYWFVTIPSPQYE